MAYQTSSTPGSGYGNVYIDSLVWGCQWTNIAGHAGQETTSNPVNITYSYGYASANGAGSAWLASETAAFGKAMQAFENVCNIEFTQTAFNTNPARQSNIIFYQVPERFWGANSGVLGEFEVPDNSTPSTHGYFNYQEASWTNLNQGSYSFVTIIHELGHGLGLAHPHDGGGEAGATIFPGVTDPWSTGTHGLNQGIWSTMSYNSGWNENPAPSRLYGWEGTPMALDIAALQAIYGANTNFNTGDNVYQLPAANGSGSYWSCLWDAGGSDTISNVGSNISCIINLNEAPLVGPNAGGYVSANQGIIGGFTIAHQTIIENAIGGNANDVFTGNSANNHLIGAAGNDLFIGIGGLDSIDGGAGLDQIRLLQNRSNFLTSYDVGAGTYRVANRYAPQDELVTTQVEFAEFADQILEIDNIAPSVFRFFNQNSGSHFYTQNKAEADYIFQNLSQFRFEGAAFNRNLESEADAINIYRFYNATSGAHYFTANQTEAHNLMAQSSAITYEGVAFQAHATKVAGTTEVYGFINNGTGAHFYTAIASEMANIQLHLSGTFTYEGIAYYSEVIG